MRVASIVLVLFLAGGLWAAGDPLEPAIDVNILKNLDDWDRKLLAKADEAFQKSQFKQGVAAYDQFIVELPKSKALAYAILRKGRCLHLDNRRVNAIDVYQEVLDYFPNDVRLAAAAQFFIGQAHRQNGFEDKAMAAWAALAKDPQYRREPLAAGAINALAEYLIGKEKADEAVKHFWQVAIDFRSKNENEARRAIEQVIVHYVRRTANEPKLREFYLKVGTFDGRPQQVPKDPADLLTDRAYWGRVQHLVRQHGRFEDLQKDQKRAYFLYWAGQCDGKFNDDDAFQIAKASFFLEADGDVPAWKKRLDDHYARLQKDGDFARTVAWMQLYIRHLDKVKEYYAKLDFKRMANPQIIEVMKMMYEGVGDETLGESVFSRLRLDDMADPMKGELAKYMYKKKPELAVRLCQSFKDADLGKFTLLGLYAADKTVKIEVVCALADELGKSETYVSDAMNIKGTVLEKAGEFTKAIGAYQLWKKFPDNGYAVARCLKGLGKLIPAIDELRTIEGLVPDANGKAQASWTAAMYFKEANKRDELVAELRKINKVYKGTGKAGEAHAELERMGVASGGGAGTDD